MAELSGVTPGSPTGTGVTSTSPNDKASATESPTVTTAAPEQPKSFLQRMKDRVLGMNAEAKPADEVVPADGSADAKPEAVEGEGGEAEAKAEDEPKPKPEDITKAQRERVNKLNEKVKASEARYAEKEREAVELRSLFEVAKAEIEHYRALLMDGAVYDENEEKLRQIELGQRGTSAVQDAAKRHAAEFEQRRNEQWRADFKAEVEPQIREAVKAHPLLSRAEIIEALKLNRNAEREVDEVAAELHAKKIEKARALIGATSPAAPAPPKERPASPTTVRAKSGGSIAVRHPPNAAGMAARLDELRRQNS